MTTNELLELARNISRKEHVTSEDRSTFDGILAKIDRMDSRVPPIPRGPIGDNAATVFDGPEIREQRSKFTDFIRYGKRYEEHRDIGTVTGSGGITGGEQLVPQAFYPVLIEAQKAWGKLIGIINVKDTDTGAPMKYALDNDTGNLAHVLGEATEVAENDPALSGSMLSTDQCVTDLVKVSIPELQDSAFDIDKWLRDKFGKRYFRGLTSMITSGSYLGSPAVAQNIQSIISGATTGCPAASNSVLAYADIVDLWGALDPAYVENATWVMNSTTRSALMKVTDSLGRPLFIPNPVTGAFERLLGAPVVLNQYMDNIGAGKVPIQFGDFKQGYLLRQVKPGLAIRPLE